MALNLTVTMNVVPGKGKTQSEAEEELATLVAEYLTSDEAPFAQDYGHSYKGSDLQGGYEGPWAKDVTVTAERLG